MADTNHSEARIEPEPGPGYAISGKIMLSAIVVLFAVVVFMVCLHVYARWYLVRLRRRQLEHRRRVRRASRGQIVMYIDSRAAAAAAPSDRGLDRSVLDSLPVFLHLPEPDRPPPPPECAVCISEFEEEEVVRHLPRCGHTFHIECIDMWFRSHSTCPLCRAAVEKVRFDRIPKTPVPVPKENAPEPGSSSGSDGRTKAPECRTGLEGEPANRLLSLKRILSMGRKSPATTSSGAGTTGETDIENRV